MSDTIKKEGAGRVTAEYKTAGRADHAIDMIILAAGSYGHLLDSGENITLQKFGQRINLYYASEQSARIVAALINL